MLERVDMRFLQNKIKHFFLDFLFFICIVRILYEFVAIFYSFIKNFEGRYKVKSYFLIEFGTRYFRICQYLHGGDKVCCVAAHGSIEEHIKEVIRRNGEAAIH